MHFALASMGLGNPQEALKASQEAVQLYQERWGGRAGSFWGCAIYLYVNICIYIYIHTVSVYIYIHIHICVIV